MKNISKIQNCVVIIPMFNESEKIAQVIAGLKRVGFDTILAIDDGSSDNGGIIAKEAGAKVLRHSINRGAGAAIGTGVEASALLKADSIVTFDGDGQHDPQDAMNLIETLEKDDVDVVLGYRDFTLKKMPIASSVANRIGNIFTRLLFGVKVKDSQSGLRAYSRRALELLSFDFLGYEYCSALVGQLRTKSLLYTEVPIATHYSEYSLSKPVRQSFWNGIKTLVRLINTSI